MFLILNHIRSIFESAISHIHLFLVPQGERKSISEVNGEKEILIILEKMKRQTAEVSGSPTVYHGAQK